MALSALDQQLARWILEQKILPLARLQPLCQYADGQQRSLYETLKASKVLSPEQLSAIASWLSDRLAGGSGEFQGSQPASRPATARFSPRESEPRVATAISPQSPSTAADNRLQIASGPFVVPSAPPDPTPRTDRPRSDSSLNATEGSLTVDPPSGLRHSVASSLNVTGQPGSGSALNHSAASRPGTALRSSAGVLGISNSWQPPSSLGPYQLQSELGRGGMGLVYKATRGPQVVALKILFPDPKAGREAYERFVEEGRVAASVRPHPNIVEVLDVGTDQGCAYMAMELVEGNNLRDLMDDEDCDEVSLIAVLARMAEALAHIHSQGIVHRDFKPSNVLIDKDKVPKLADFGVAKVEDREGMTATGQVVGTLSYMAPEQAQSSRQVDHRADIYSLGASLYEILTGRVPYTGDTAVMVLAALLQSNPTPPRELRPGIDPDIEAICLKAMARKPEDRYSNASILAAELDSWLRGEGSEASRLAKAARAKKLSVLALAVIGLTLLVAIPLILKFARTEPELSSPRGPGAKPDPDPASPAPTTDPGGDDQSPSSPQNILVDAELNSLNLPESGWVTASTFELQGQAKPTEARFRARLLNERGKATQSVMTQVRAGLFHCNLALPDGRWTLELALSQPDGGPWQVVRSQPLQVDSAFPVLSVDNAPPEGAPPPKVEAETFRLTGLCQDSQLSSFTINEKEVLVHDGRFSADFQLSVGINEFILVARDAAGQETRRVTSVQRVPIDMALEFKDINSDSWVSVAALELSGQVKPKDVALSYAGAELKLTGEGAFKLPLSLTEGRNEFTFLLRKSGSALEKVLVINCDTIAPEIQFKVDPSGLHKQSKVPIELSFNEPLSELKIHKDVVKPTEGKELSAHKTVLELPDGKHQIEISATDRVGHVTRIQANIEVDTRAPVLSYRLEPTKAQNFRYDFVARLDEQSLESASLSGDPLNFDESGQLRMTLLASKLKKGLLFVAKDKAGHETQVRVTLAGQLRSIQEATTWAELGTNSNGKKLIEAEVAEIANALRADFKYLDIQSFASGGASYRIARFRHISSGLTMHLVPGGICNFGFPDQQLFVAFIRQLDPKKMPDEERIRNVFPNRKISVPPFLIAAHELDRGAWNKVAAREKSISKKNLAGNALPVAGITCEEAKDWLKAAGGGLRLPSEVEWDYATRAGTSGLFYWGPNFDKSHVWCYLNAKTLVPVGEHDKAVNAFGLRDTLGNVAELCLDHYRSSYAEGPKSCKAVTHDARPVQRVTRGGSFEGTPPSLAWRWHLEDGKESSHVGLRPARPLDLPAIVAAIEKPGD